MIRSRIRSSGFPAKTTAALLLVGVIICGLAALAAAVEVPANVRVGIVTTNKNSSFRNAGSVTFAVKGSYQVVDLAALPGMNVIGTPAEGESWQVYYLATGLQVFRNGQSLAITSGPVVVRETAHSSDNRVTLVDYGTGGPRAPIGRMYRGNMEFRSYGNSVVAVNELPLDEYLYGVVPREMGSGWPLEALKAQALAARTYTVANYSKHVVEGFNMLDTPADQAYGGANAEASNATRAVQETSGQIITYDGRPISAVYHSTSGGHTEDNENVWGGTPLPYLRGKPDPYSTRNGYANWTFTTTLDEIRNRLIQSGFQTGPIAAVRLEKYKSGRVKNVIITDIGGNTITITGSQFGKLFNPDFYTYKSTTSFMSNFFDVKMDLAAAPTFYVLDGSGQAVAVPGASLYGVSDDGTVGVLNGAGADFYVQDADGVSSFNKAASGTVVFEGHGWGHGVGMSQWGAYEMASQGKSYIDILTFYYTGVTVGN